MTYRKTAVTSVTMHIPYTFRTCPVIVETRLSQHSTTYHRSYCNSCAIRSTNQPCCRIYLAFYKCVSVLHFWSSMSLTENSIMTSHIMHLELNRYSFFHSTVAPNYCLRIEINSAFSFFRPSENSLQALETFHNLFHDFGLKDSMTARCEKHFSGLKTTPGGGRGGAVV